MLALYLCLVKPNPMLSTRYRHYPTGLKLQYVAGALPKTILKQIPRSTRFYWKGLKPPYYWYPCDYTVYDHQNPHYIQSLIQNKRLLQCLRVLLYVILMYQDLLKNFTIQQIHILSIRNHIKRLLAIWTTLK